VEEALRSTRRGWTLRPAARGAPLTARDKGGGRQQGSVSARALPLRAGRIADYLKRFHQIALARPTVHRLLGKHGGRLPANQQHLPHKERWQRYEKPQPGHRLQVDVKFLERIPGTRKRLYQFTAIDDCTRIRVLKIYKRAISARTAIRFLDDVLRRLPFRVHVVQTDNGAEFQSQFHWHLESRDVKHVYIRPHTPRLNGKVERSHRVDDQEFYQLLDRDGITDNIHLFNVTEGLRPYRRHDEMAQMLERSQTIKRGAGKRQK
jgi:transposase InsO family protein